MRYVAMMLLGFSLSMLVGCSDSDIEAPPPVSKPVKTILVSGEGGEGVRHFPARVEANQTANLSFRIPGTLKELNAKESENVKAGQMLARLDPTSIEIEVREQEANFQTAKANFERAEELMPDGFISRSDYDQLKGRFETARAVLDKAKQNLSYTQLLVPFDGRIAKRWVDNFEDVQAKEVIISLNNPDLLELVIQVPESLIQQLNRRPPGQQAEDITATAAFENHDNKKIPLIFKEITTNADPTTQTFAATFTMPEVEGITLLPGMSATVTVDLSKRMQSNGTNPWVPSAAVFGDKEKTAQVYIVNEETMTIEARDVETGRVGSASVEIMSGLQAGERVVIAGVSFLQPDQLVSLMPDVEQATAN